MHPTGQTGAQFARMAAKMKQTYQKALSAIKKSFFYTCAG